MSSKKQDMVTLFNTTRREITVNAKGCLTKRSRLKALVYSLPIREPFAIPVTHYRQLVAKGQPLHSHVRSGDVEIVDRD